MELILELKEEHQEIAILLSSLRNRKLDARTKLRVLLKAKTLLIDHLKKEEEFLYPAIIESTNKKSYSIARKFAEDMKNLSTEIIEYFIIFENDINQGRALTNLGTMLSKLTRRIRREENILFQEYEKL